MSRAAYMREYRAKRKAKLRSLTGDPAIDLVTVIKDGIETERDVIRAEARIRELEAEVARLKRELAQRPDYTVTAIEKATDRFTKAGAQMVERSFPEFRPVPKPGRK